MKNHMKLATKRLIVNVASAHELTPSHILSLHDFAQSQNTYNPAAYFSGCLYAAKTKKYTRTLKRFFDGESKFPITSEQFEILIEQFKDNRYYFVYDTINNFYKSKSSKLFFKDPNKIAPRFSYATLNTRLVAKSVEDTKDINIKQIVTIDNTIIIPTAKEIAKLRLPSSPIPSLIHEKPIIWEKQQATALRMIYAWLKSTDEKQIFRLFGYAGTGKTFLAKEVARFVNEHAGRDNVGRGGVLFAAFSGKASSVLRRNGCTGASTIHSLLYKPIIDPKTGQCTGFMLNGESPLLHAALLIVDEVSMVNEEMAKDLMSFGVRILVLGDPKQLKPVKGEGFFINCEPDFMLTDIRRQTKDNPIIYLATRVREHKSLKPGKYGSSRVYASGAYVSSDMMAEHSQVLVGLNATRKGVNIKLRKHNGKYDKDSMFPVKGDRLICLKNNKDNGLYNGTMWTSSNVEVRKIMQAKFKGANTKVQGHQDILFFKIRSEDEVDRNGDLIKLETQVSPHIFNPSLPEPAYRSIAGCDEFAFGYGITVHKSQGSQWKSVFIIDESSTFRDESWHHLYTGITRGVEYVTVVLQ